MVSPLAKQNRTGIRCWTQRRLINSPNIVRLVAAGYLRALILGFSSQADAGANVFFNGGTPQITGNGLTSFFGLGRSMIYSNGVTEDLDVVKAGVGEACVGVFVEMIGMRPNPY